jgi:O-antigen ligase
MIWLAYATVWIFVFSLPWSWFTATNGIVIISKVTGALALISAVSIALLSGRLRRLHPFHLAAFFFVLTAGMGQLLFQEQVVPKKLFTFIQLLLAIWAIWQLAPGRRQVLGLLMAYVLGAYVAALGTILLYIREADELHRFAAGGADPNDLAMTLALALPMAWYLALTYRQPLLQWLARGYLAIGLLGIGLTGSRGGMLATIVALTIVPLTLTRLSPNRRATAILFLMLSGGIAAAYIPDKIVQRLGTTTSEVEDLSIGGRFKLWVAGMRAFTQRPIMGYGPAGYKSAITSQLGRLTQVAHNSYISVLVEEGLVGFLCYALMVLVVFRAVLYTSFLERRFGLVLLATLLVAMTPLTWEDAKPVWFVLAALVGLARARIGPGDQALAPAHSQRAISVPLATKTPRSLQWTAGAHRTARGDGT